ncbi:hypothetical protein QFC20_006428 [Naganishia adeliensis]|uniref:Uncharacterized protein n=1 Tax=Naganishia adeliensis TaxID=92952 RepID=A0ACC2VBL7_9TREE|nr:hypothetical protein QFC20_006428 [Naganishia adeliensis]
MPQPIPTPSGNRPAPPDPTTNSSTGNMCDKDHQSKLSGHAQVTEQLRGALLSKNLHRKRTDRIDQIPGIETYIGDLTEKNAQLCEINRSLKNRLDSSNRLLEEAKTTNLHLHWQLERDKKRSWEEAQQMDSEMIAVKATRDYYKGRLDICQLENKRLKRIPVAEVDQQAAETATRATAIPLQAITSPNQGKPAAEENKDKNSTGRPRNGREASPTSMLNAGTDPIHEEDDLGDDESLSRVLAFETLPYGKP